MIPKGSGLVLLAAISVCHLLCVGPAQGYQFSNVKQLTADLFSNYSKSLRPFVDDSKPTFVYMGLWLASIVDLDEINQELSFSAFLYLDWIDKELSWDTNNYNGTNHFSWEQQYLWIPDVTIINSVENMQELGYDRNYMLIDNSGTVIWMPSGVYSVSCDIDVTYYPFDSQTCVIIFSTLVSTSAEIELQADSVYGVYLELYSESGTWELTSSSSSTYSVLNGKSRVAFTLELRRLRTFYVVSLLIPVGFLAFTATLVFALPAESGEKMGTAITVLLAYAVYLTIVSDQMPKTSLHVSVLAVYLNIVLAMTSAGVVLSVWILNLHFRDDEKPPSLRIRKIVLFIRSLMCKRKKNTVDPFQINKPTTNGVSGRSSAAVFRTPSGLKDSGPMDDPAERKCGSLQNAFDKKNQESEDSDEADVPVFTWKVVSVTFDRFLFYSFTGLLALSSLIFMMVLLIGTA